MKPGHPLSQWRRSTRIRTVLPLAMVCAMPCATGVANAQQVSSEQDPPVAAETLEDSDQDAVLDSFDQCPTQPETYNGVTDDDGCPDTAPDLGHLSGTITAVIPLVGRRMQVVRDVEQILDLVTRLLRAHPGIQQLTIEAHTDARGADEWNLRLSQARAEYIRDELVRRGIDASRLVATGFGERCPLVRGVGPRVWNRNRRIAFVVTRSSDAGFRAGTAGCGTAAAP